VPLVGLGATMNGWDASNPFLKFLARYTGVLMYFVALVEMNLSDNPNVQSFYTMYHIPIAILSILSSMDAAKVALGWLPAILMSLFCIGGIIGEE